MSPSIDGPERIAPKHVEDVPEALAVMRAHITDDHFMDEVAGWIDGLQEEVKRLQGFWMDAQVTIDGLQGDVAERMRVNVGLIAANTELKRQAPSWSREGLTKVVVGAVRSTVEAHGSEARGAWAGSLAKRIVNQVLPS